MNGGTGWAILGTGHVANAFARGLDHSPAARKQAVCSRDASRASAFASVHGFARHVSNVPDVLDDERVDAVYLASPPSMHAGHALECLNGGKAVLVEKPFALNAAEGREVIDCARRHGLFCMEAMWMRFMPAVRLMHALVEKGEIGAARILEAGFGVPVKADGDAWLFDESRGGGALLDRAVYPVSLAVSLFGTPQDVVSQVTRSGNGVDDLVSLSLRFAAGEIALLSACLGAYGSNEAVVGGTEGRIRIHEPLCRPDTLTVDRRNPVTIGGEAHPSSGGLKERLRESHMVRRIRDLLGTAASRSSRHIHAAYTGNGYCHEADETSRCLHEGLTESPVMPWDETLCVLETMDLARSRWPGAQGTAAGTGSGD